MSVKRRNPARRLVIILSVQFSCFLTLLFSGSAQLILFQASRLSICAVTIVTARVLSL